jgi:hypothetical protein
VKKFMLVTSGAVLAMVGVLSGLAASASSDSEGVVTGRVFECGPGPIVISPNRPAPSPIPDSVTLWRGGREVTSVPIGFTAAPPWSGRFTVRVSSGRYEVISSYLHQVAWVRVRASATSVVHFGPFACPMQLAN